MVDLDPTSISKKSKKTYTIKKFGPPEVDLGCDYAQVKRGSKTQWVMGSYNYISECLSKVCLLLKVTTFWKEKLP